MPPCPFVPRHLRVAQHVSRSPNRRHSTVSAAQDRTPRRCAETRSDEPVRCQSRAPWERWSSTATGTATRVKRACTGLNGGGRCPLFDLRKSASANRGEPREDCPAPGSVPALGCPGFGGVRPLESLDRDDLVFISNSDTAMGWRQVAFTGMRRGVALALRWRDVDLDARRIAVRRSVGVAKAKGEGERLVTSAHAFPLVGLSAGTSGNALMPRVGRCIRSRREVPAGE